jgi:MFS family permease
LLLPLAVLGDRFGRRLLLVIGLLLFGGASTAAALASSPGALIVSRGVMGAGGACAMPATLAIVGNVFSPAERGRAIAVWSSVAGFAAAAGPLLGGVLLSRFWWGSVFLVNVPIVVLGVTAAILLVPESRDPAAPRIDWAGAALWTGALVGLLFGIIEGPVRGWATSVVLGAFASSSVLLFAFAKREQRAPAPLLAPRTARHPGMQAGATTITTIFFGVFGAQFVLTQWLQGPQDLRTIPAAACFLPNALGSITGSLLNPRLVRRQSHAFAIAIGASTMTSGLLLTGIGVGIESIAVAVVGFGIVGLGAGLMIPSGIELIMTSAPPEQAGSAAGVNETIVEAGGAVGVAVLGSVLAGTGSYAWPIPVAAVVLALAASVAVRIQRQRAGSLVLTRSPASEAQVS